MKNLLIALAVLIMPLAAWAQITPPGSAGNLIVNAGSLQFGAIAPGLTLTETAPTTPASVNVTQRSPRLVNTGTDTVLSTDYALPVNYTGSGTTVTFPLASSASFFTGFGVTPGNFGSGLVILSRTSPDYFVTPYGNLNTVIIPVGMACYVYSDGAHWQVDPSSCPPVSLVLHGYTVSTLPTGTVGFMAAVTDATSCTKNGSLTGSGSTYCAVVYNGSAWVGL